MSTQEPFKTAQDHSRKLAAKPTNDELLDLYALFKVGEGKDIASEEAPGMFDLKGKAKRKAWQKLVDEGVTEADAQKRYIDLVQKLKDQYGFDAEKVPETVGSN